MIMKSSTPSRRAYSQVARAAATEETGKRIVDGFLELLMTDWFDTITLDRVASRSGVAVPTIVRRFGGKDGLLRASIPVLSAQIGAQRASPSGDRSAVVDRLISDYERTGDAVIRLLALAPRYPVVEQLTEYGRGRHREWVSTAFVDATAALEGGALQETLDALVVATDVYTWKLLRRDLQRSAEQTANTMKRLVSAALGPNARPRSKGDSR